MNGMILRLFFAAALALAWTAAQAQGYSPAAQRVLTQARQAAGGTAWNMLRGWHESGKAGGLAYERWFDPLRYGMRVETHEPAGLDVRGFNGSGDWRVTPAGAVTGVDVRGMTSAARTEAFFGAHGYFFPGRFDARGELVGVRKTEGRAYDVVMVKPWAGLPRELWFDRRTHLLCQMVDRNGPRPVAVQIGDYRKVGPVKVAFRTALEGVGAGAGDLADRQVESVVFAPADRAIFSLPRPGSD